MEMAYRAVPVVPMERAMPHLSMWFLGGYRVSLDGEPVRGIEYDKVRALLACLALEADRPHRREALAGLLWPGLPERRARRNLSQALFSLRSALSPAGHTQADPPHLIVTPQSIQFDAASDHWLDVSAFLAMRSACHEHPHWRLETCPTCADRLGEAVTLYRGPFLEGLSIGDSPAFEEWQLFRRERLHALASDALGALATSAEARGAHEAALAYAQRWVQLDRWHEGAHQALMRALALSGRRGAALAQYERCRRTLREELGVEPAEGTDALYQQILDGEMPQPSIRPLPNDLPASLTPLIGRAKELAHLTSLLREQSCRLVTIAGPGGIGKTHLALQFAADLVAQAPADRFTDGVYYLPLAAVPSLDALLSALLQTLGLTHQPGIESRQQLLSYLRRKHLLLVLDNFEHLAVTWREQSSTALLAEILHRAPGVSILVTSRVRLDLAAEHVLDLTGLPYPRSAALPAQEMQRFGAVQLFLQAAHRVRPDPGLPETELPNVAHVCQIVEGMPLAIVLAAAWCDVQSPAEIERHVARELGFLAADYRDLPPRQRSLRAVFDSAWTLLGEAERKAFARLSIFRGPFTAEAAEAVAGAGVRTLRALIHKSFLTRGAMERYEVHALLRQYGQARLEEVPEEAQDALEQHHSYYVTLVKSNQATILYADPQQVGSELQDIRAAWHWAVAHGRSDEIPTLAISLHELYAASLRYEEGEADMARAAQAMRASKPEGRRGVALGVVLAAQGNLARAAGAPERARHLFEESLPMLRRLGAEHELAWASCQAAGAAQRYDEARDLLLESLTISRRLDLAWEEAYTLVALAALEIKQGHYAEAERYRRQGLALSREIGFDRTTAFCLLGEGHMAYEQGAYAPAEPALREALALFQSVAPQWALFAQSLLGDVASATGEYEEAESYYRLVLAACRDLGFAWSEVMAGDCLGIGPTLNRLGDVALAVGDDEKARRRYREALAIAAQESYLGLKLDALARQAVWLAREGRAERAVELGALVVRHPACANPTRKVADALLSDLQQALPPDTYAVAVAQGRTGDVDAALCERLAEWRDRPGS
jgi:DNA-binding SARP family transcriptional activator/predicted ATPase